MIFRTNKYYLLILLVAFIVGGCGNSSGNYEEIESSASSESTTTTTDTTAQMGGSIQGVELSLSTVVTTLAGTGSSGSANGTGNISKFLMLLSGLLQMEQTYMWQIRIIT